MGESNRWEVELCPAIYWVPGWVAKRGVDGLAAKSDIEATFLNQNRNKDEHTGIGDEKP